MGYYYAELDHQGNGNCGHRHRTRIEARRCLPKLPPGPGYYSRARIRFVPDDTPEPAQSDQKAMGLFLPPLPLPE